jgi:hypothetical protein
MSEGRIGWLAGIIDGEGTVSLCRTNSKRYKNMYLKAILQIANTDIRILQKADQIFREDLGVDPCVVKANRRKGVNINKNWKMGFRLQIHSQRRLAKALPILMPYLVGKREQAEIVLAYCLRRNVRQKHKSYEERSFDAQEYMRCRKLNQRGVTVESGGESPAQAGEGAFRTTEESVEVAEMTTRPIIN